ncbi:hypothetical protein H9Q69_005643 [Fusarium xylarioides]|nr:hypothetical protein H9Q69_005643 [Fusarium xylarioides]
MSNTSVEDAKSGFLEEGFYQFEDPEIGSKIEEMRAHHLPFSMSEETGLDFWRKNIRYNTQIQDILSALGPEPRSRYILIYQGFLAPDPAHIQTSQVGGKPTDYLTVQAWPKKSKVTFYSRSHTTPGLTRITAPNTLWEFGEAQLLQKGCEAKSCSFEQGGWVIADGRIGYRREYERSYVWAYAKLNVLEQYLEEQRKSQTPGRPVGVQPPASCDVDELVKLGVHVLR